MTQDNDFDKARHYGRLYERSVQERDHLNFALRSITAVLATAGTFNLLVVDGESATTLTAYGGAGILLLSKRALNRSIDKSQDDIIELATRHFSEDDA